MARYYRHFCLFALVALVAMPVSARTRYRTISDPQAIVTLAATDIRTLSSHPVILIPAPGVGKAIWVHDIWGELKFNTVAFDQPPNGIDWGVGFSGYPYLVDLRGLFGSDVSNTLQTAPAYAGNPNTRTTAENAALILSADVDSTVGDGTGQIIINYEIVTLLP